MNKKLLAGLMSVVMLAGSGATVGAEEVGKSKVSNNSVVRFVKNHKKIIAGILVVGAVAGVGYYKREEVKKGFNTAKDKVNSLIKSKPAENKESVKQLGDIVKTNPEGRVRISKIETIDRKDVICQPEIPEDTKAEVKDYQEIKEKSEEKEKAEVAKIRKDMEDIGSKIQKLNKRIDSAKGSLNSKNANNNKIMEKIHELEVKKSKFEIELRNKEMELKKYN